MSADATSAAELPWSRPSLTRNGPRRVAGGLYRTAQGNTPTIGGVPLTTSEDAVAAAVRLAYKVADAQIARSMRLAERLRTAGDRGAGPNSDRKAVDAAERLVFRAMMSAVSWVEAAGAEGGSPINRLLAAEYRLLGALFGLAPAAEPAAAQRHERHHRRDDIPQPFDLAPAKTTGLADRVTIAFSGEVRRAVVVTKLTLEKDDASWEDNSLAFYSAGAVSPEPIHGSFRYEAGGRPLLTIDMTATAPMGLWKAAICLGKTLVGLIEIEL